MKPRRLHSATTLSMVTTSVPVRAIASQAAQPGVCPISRAP